MAGAGIGELMPLPEPAGDTDDAGIDVGVDGLIGAPAASAGRQLAIMHQQAAKQALVRSARSTYEEAFKQNFMNGISISGLRKLKSQSYYQKQISFAYLR